jgi:YD repeat-containing protein
VNVGRQTTLAAVISCVLACPWDAQANVSLKNGNFFIGFTDVIFQGGLEMKVERVYNSKTDFKGMFGWGWGTDYESYCTPELDGSILFHQYGGGAEVAFMPMSGSILPERAAGVLLEQALKTDRLASTRLGYTEYRHKLDRDASFRRDEEAAIRKSSKSTLRPAELPPPGTKLESHRFGYEVIDVRPDGLRRTKEGTSTQVFDRQCALSRIEDKNGNYVELTYRPGERSASGAPEIDMIRDNDGRELHYTWTGGLVTDIRTKDGHRATYRYVGSELVETKDVDGNVYRYRYSPDSRHDMIAIEYSDNTTMEITYVPPWKQESVHSVKDRDGTLTVYGYSIPDATRADVGVEVFGSNGDLISRSSYLYRFATTPQGESYDASLTTILDGDRTVTSYTPHGLPTLIEHGSEVTRFAYDDEGHVTLKDTPTESTELAYDLVVKKVVSVKRYPHLQPDKATTSEFRYDSKGNLVWALSSEGKELRLEYDDHGRIRAIQAVHGPTIRFEYNANSKPVRITQVGVGDITVTYSSNGEIEKVDSSAGRKIALEVTTVFQELLDVIRPAGVSLSF